MSIAEQINEILKWLHSNKDNLDAVQCSQKLVEISVLKASLDSELADLEIEYNLKLKETLGTIYNNKPITYAMAKVFADTSDEFRKLHKMKAVAGSMLEVARSIKRYQNAVRDQMEMSKNF